MFALIHLIDSLILFTFIGYTIETVFLHLQMTQLTSIVSFSLIKLQ